MRLFHRFQAGLLAVALLALSGCGASLNVKKSVTVLPLTEQQILIDNEVDKVTVEIKSPGVDVNAYLVLQSNLEAALKSLQENKTPKDMLTSQEKKQEIKLDAAPGRKPFALILQTPSGKKAEVSVTFTGK